jgi:hypothetical protein
MKENKIEINEIKKYKEFFDNLSKNKKFKNFDLTKKIFYDNKNEIIFLENYMFKMNFNRNINVLCIFTEVSFLKFNNMNDFEKRFVDLLINAEFPKIKNEHIIKNHNDLKDINNDKMQYSYCKRYFIALQTTGIYYKKNEQIFDLYKYIDKNYIKDENDNLVIKFKKTDDLKDIKYDIFIKLTKERIEIITKEQTKIYNFDSFENFETDLENELKKNGYLENMVEYKEKEIEYMSVIHIKTNNHYIIKDIILNATDNKQELNIIYSNIYNITFSRELFEFFNKFELIHFEKILKFLEEKYNSYLEIAKNREKFIEDYHIIKEPFFKNKYIKKRLLTAELFLAVKGYNNLVINKNKPYIYVSDVIEEYIKYLKDNKE